MLCRIKLPFRWNDSWRNHAVRSPFRWLVLICLSLFSFSPTGNAQTINWNGTWSGTFFRIGTLPCGNSYTNSGTVTLTLSVSNNNVSGSAVAINGGYCYDTATCGLLQHYDTSGPVSGMVSSNIINITFAYTATSGPCAGDVFQPVISGTNSGSEIIGSWNGNGSIVLTGGSGFTSFLPFEITSIVRTNTHDLLITWNTSGTNNIVQVSSGAEADGSYSSNDFADVTNIVVTTATTNFWDVGAATNYPARYYRILSP